MAKQIFQISEWWQRINRNSHYKLTNDHWKDAPFSIKKYALRCIFAVLVPVQQQDTLIAFIWVSAKYFHQYNEYSKDTDVKLFLALSNPENTNSAPPNMTSLQTHQENSEEEDNSDDSDGDQSDNNQSEDENEQSEDNSSEAEEANDETPPPLISTPLPNNLQGYSASRVSFKPQAPLRSDVSRRSSKSGVKSQVFQERWNRAEDLVGTPYSFSNAPPVRFASRAILSSEELYLKNNQINELENWRQHMELLIYLKWQTWRYAVRSSPPSVKYWGSKYAKFHERRYEVSSQNWMANSKLGPFLELLWAGKCQEIHKYDNALGRLYKKYWRKSSMSPEMELACGILGSLGMHHFKKKVMPSVLDPGFTSQFIPKMGESRNQNQASRFEEDDEQLPAAFLWIHSPVLFLSLRGRRWR